MKKVFTSLLAVAFAITSFASGASSVPPAEKPTHLKASQMIIPIGKNGAVISLEDLSTIKVKDLESLTGNKMKLVEKVGFKLVQKQLRNSINTDGTVNAKKLSSLLPKAKKATEKSKQYLRLWLILLGVAIVFSILAIFVGFFWIFSALASLGALIFFVLWIISLSGSM
ncbi:MAG TPA: hypothetical protein VNR87_17225 [Flavisolibacter sp.]|nr:hypothetical protein [Flavisolibacter sp.]